MRLLDHQVATLQAVLVGKVGKLVNHILFLKIFGQLADRIHVPQRLAVGIRIFEGILDDESAHGCLLII